MKILFQNFIYIIKLYRIGSANENNFLGLLEIIMCLHSVARLKEALNLEIFKGY